MAEITSTQYSVEGRGPARGPEPRGQTSSGPLKNDALKKLEQFKAALANVKGTPATARVAHLWSLYAGRKSATAAAASH